MLRQVSVQTEEFTSINCHLHSKQAVKYVQRFHLLPLPR